MDPNQPSSNPKQNPNQPQQPDNAAKVTGSRPVVDREALAIAKQEKDFIRKTNSVIQK